MADLKKSWKQTAKSFVLAFNDLGSSVVDSLKVGKDAAVEWAKKDNPHVENGEQYETEGVEIADEEPVAEPEAAAAKPEAAVEPEEVKE